MKSSEYAIDEADDDADNKFIIEDSTIKTSLALTNSSKSSSMTLYQISYINGKASYSLVPIKSKEELKLSSKNKNDFESITELACEECGLTFPTETRLKWHRSTHNPLSNRKSPKKAKRQESGSNLTKSQRRKSQRSGTEDKEKIVNHVKPGLTFICPSCEFNTTERSLMISHFTTTHCFKSSDIKWESTDQILFETADEVEQQFITEMACDCCGFTSQNQDDMDFHTCLPSDEQMLSCHLCTFECPTRSGLQSHITRKHKPKPDLLECSECDFKCDTKAKFSLHRKKHRREAAKADGKQQYNFFCDECDFVASRKGSLYLHIQRRHKGTESVKPEKPRLYQCDQCDYTNKNKYEIKVHVIRKHTNDYNHECEQCGKKYKIKGDLTNHIRFQHREQPIICDVCGKTCGNSNSLYVHQKFAHYKAEFECPVCHRRMVSQANLDDHILKQHEQRKDAICQECGKTFTRHSRLKIHMRIHTGLRPHSCKICNKAFARKTALRQHLLIHTGQRPYICDICGKAFTQKPGLISHRKSHPGSLPPLPRVTIDHVLSDLLTEEQNTIY